MYFSSLSLVKLPIFFYFDFAALLKIFVVVLAYLFYSTGIFSVLLCVKTKFNVNDVKIKLVYQVFVTIF